MTLLLGKIFFSVCVVLGLSWIAEHVNSRIAGILSGMPLGAVLVLFFVGGELGDGFAAESALHGVSSIAATIAFSLGYYFSSYIESRFSPLISSLGGLTSFAVVASALSTVTIDLPAAIILALVVLVTTAFAFRSSETTKISQKAHMTLPRMVFRSAMAAGFVVAITTFADFIGPHWAGLLIGFPMTFLPFLLIIHITYSAEHIRAIIQSFPMGLVGLLCFLTIATQTIPRVGVNWAIVVSLAGALVYFAILGMMLNRKQNL